MEPSELAVPYTPLGPSFPPPSFPLSARAIENSSIFEPETVRKLQLNATKKTKILFFIFTTPKNLLKPLILMISFFDKPNYLQQASEWLSRILLSLFM